MEKTTWMQQNIVINKDNINEVKLSVTAKEHKCNACKIKKKDVERNDTEIENT